MMHGQTQIKFFAMMHSADTCNDRITWGMMGHVSDIILW